MMAASQANYPRLARPSYALARGASTRGATLALVVVCAVILGGALAAPLDENLDHPTSGTTSNNPARSWPIFREASDDPEMVTGVHRDNTTDEQHDEEARVTTVSTQEPTDFQAEYMFTGRAWCLEWIQQMLDCLAKNNDLEFDEKLKSFMQVFEQHSAEEKMVDTVKQYHNDGDDLNELEFKLGDIWRPDEPLGANINNYAPDEFSEAEIMRLFELGAKLRAGERLACGALLTSGIDDLESRGKTRRLNRDLCKAYTRAMLRLPTGRELTERQVAEEGDDAICPICLDALASTTDNETSVLLACTHTFHATCLARWFQEDTRTISRCPACRQRLRIPFGLSKTEQ